MRLIAVPEKQMLAIKAVVYGCNTNKRLVGASYMANIRSESPEMISYYEAIKAVYEMLEQSTIEAEPVRHGRWEQCFEDWRHQIEGDKCSACGFEHYGSSISHYKYCPHCGAKMENGTALSEAEPLAGCADDADLEHMTRFAMQQAVNRK